MKTRKINFLALAVLLLAAVGLAGVTGLAFNQIVLAAPGAAPEAAVRAAPMQTLPEAACTDTGGTLTCHLWAREGSLVMPGGSVVPVWGFTDSELGPAAAPGPILRASVGQTVEIVLHNEIPGQNVALSFPGQAGLVPDLNGAAQGGMVSYTFVAQSAGTFLYEAGLTPEGARQVAMGLFGPLVIEDGTEPGDLEVVMVFSEIDPAFNTDPLNFSMFEFHPRYWLINGQAFPDTGEITVAAGSTVLMRLLNAGVQTHPIGLLGLDQTVIAADGVAEAHPYGVNTAPLAPGQTKDTLIQVPSDAVDGTLYTLYNSSLLQHNNNQKIGRRTAFGGMLAFLKVSSTGAPSPLGPVVSDVAVNPAKTNGLVDVLLTATLTDDDTDVAGFEYFIDNTSGAGTWVPVEPAPQVFASVTIPTTILETLSGGQHTFYVRGQDAFGNWGSFGSAVLTLDKAGPSIIGTGLTPNPTNGSRDVSLTGTADDRNNGNSIIIAAEWQMDSAGWMPLVLFPLNSPLTGLTATIPAANIAALYEGEHAVEIRAQDEFMNWSNPYGTATLRVDKTGPQVGAVSLTPNLIDLSKPLPTTVRLNASLTDPLSGGIQSTLVTAEAFIDTVGAPGTGFTLFPSDGLFDEISEDVYYNIPGAVFSNLSPGDHMVMVLGKDQAGNWGTANAALITIVAKIVDTTGPVVSNVVLTPVAGTTNVLLTATATDSQSNVAGAVWFEGTTPPRKTNLMTASDGAYDSLTENVQATINTSKMKPGTYPISVRAYDAAGNWGGIVTVYLVVPSR